MEGQSRLGRFDSVSIAGIAIFGALSVILTSLSQSLGLNFPVIPYLQFDFGEVAILLALFVFGPIPAVVSSFIEFLALFAIGKNVPIGPVLKIIAILASLGGVWLGIGLASRLKRVTLDKAVGGGTAFGLLFRAAIMTIPNYYLIVFLFSVDGTAKFLASSFKLIGVNLTNANVLLFVLGLTAIFNLLQLLLVMLISYFIIRLPQVRNVRAAGRHPWLVSLIQSRSGHVGGGNESESSGALK